MNIIDCIDCIVSNSSQHGIGGQSNELVAIDRNVPCVEPKGAIE